MQAAELFWESHHLACTRASWSVEFTSRSRNGRVFFLGQDRALPGAPKELGARSTSQPEEVFSPAPLHPQTVLPPAPVDRATSFVKVSISTALSVLSETNVDVHVME